MRGKFRRGASVETSEETTTEEVTQETTGSSKSEQASTPKAKSDLPTVNCAGFGSPGGAEQFFFNATPEQKEALDPNGNGIPCDEEGNKANPKNKAPGGGPKLSPEDQEEVNLLNCQAREVEEDLGPVEQERLTQELVEDIEAGRGTSLAGLLAERGYTCGELAADVLGEGS